VTILGVLTAAWVAASAAALLAALFPGRAPRPGFVRRLPFLALLLLVAHAWASLRQTPFVLLFALPGYLATLGNAALAAVPSRWRIAPALVRRTLAAAGLVLLVFSAQRIASSSKGERR
jgi:hypothetical protein